MKKTSYTRSVFLGLCLALVSLPALALDLPQARTQGLVGELPTGYVGMVKSGAGVQTLIAEVNARRKQEYQRISKENGEAVDVVAKLAAVQVIQKLPAGSLYQSPDGKWVAK